MKLIWSPFIVDSILVDLNYNTQIQPHLFKFKMQIPRTDPDFSLHTNINPLSAKALHDELLK